MQMQSHVQPDLLIIAISNATEIMTTINKQTYVVVQITITHFGAFDIFFYVPIQ